MNYLVRMSLLGAALCAASTAQTCPAGGDPNVRSLLKSTLNTLGVSFTQHAVWGLGDCAAASIAANLRLADLQNPDTSERVVRLLEYAFSMPSMIRQEEYRQPRVALLLLDLVAEHATDAATRLSARDLTQRLDSAKSGR